jgi:glycerol-3-phosphate cytidylyltransferase
VSRPVPLLPRIVFVPGVWDLLHVGHINLLWRARALGDILVVGVVSSWGCREYKHVACKQSLPERMDAVRQLTFVDVVEEQESTDPTPLLERFRPQVLVHGDDWKKLIRGNETLERLGIELVLLPYTPDVSSTALRKAATSTYGCRI